MKINTFIVGFPKSGTTSLHYYLNQHPDVCMSNIKEPNFFSSNEIAELYYDNTVIKTMSDYIKLFDHPDNKILGESSVSYIYYSSVAKKIFNYNNNAKIIIILRNPIDRAFSHFLMDNRLGYCNINFKEVISNPKKYPLFYQQYIDIGHYYEKLKVYIDIFKKENIKILIYEDFIKETQKYVNEVFDFLEIKRFKVDISPKNSFKKPSNFILEKLYKFKIFRNLFNLLPIFLINTIKSIFFKDVSKPILDADLKSKLFNIYEDSFSELSVLTQKDLTKWKIKR